MPTIEQIRKIWSRLPAAQRLFLAVVVVALIAIVVAIGSWAGREEYGVLYANLDPNDAAAAVDHLRSESIPYRLSNEGRTIAVPQESVYEMRLSLASSGLPQAGGQGYELLDTNQMGWTDFVQKLQFRRALEGEITRTIQSLEAVQQARVHIVTPEPALFAQEDRPPTASVMVRVRPGARLAPGEVQGIVHLVAASVEGLQPEHVTVLDTAGRLLSRPSAAESLLGSTSDQIQLIRTVEEGLAAKAQSALEQVLGPRKAVVRVSVDLDLERAERTREIFDGANPVVRSEQRNEENGTDGGTLESSTTNYEISKTIERIVNTPGSVQRLAASVFIDGTYQAGPDGARQYVPRSSTEMGKLQSLIETALGYDARRGDQLTVENIPFENEALGRAQEEMEESQRFQWIQRFGSLGISAVLALGALLLLWRVFARGQAKLVPAPAAGPEGEWEDSLSLKRNPQAQRIERRLQQVSRESPDALARVVRAWLRE